LHSVVRPPPDGTRDRADIGVDVAAARCSTARRPLHWLPLATSRCLFVQTRCSTIPARFAPALSVPALLYTPGPFV